MTSDDPIDGLLDAAASCAAKRLDEGTFVGFDFPCDQVTRPADVLGGKHDALEMREDPGENGGGRQRGMYAKRDIKAGTRLVVAKPIVVCWDVEDGSSDDEEDDELKELSSAQLDSGESGDDDHEVNCEFDTSQHGDEVVDVEMKLGKSVDQRDPASKCATETPSEDDRSGDSDSDIGDDGDGSAQEATGTKRNGILVLRALSHIEKNPSVWTDTLSKLFPRDANAALSLPPWFCADPSVGLDIDARFRQLASQLLFPSRENEATCKDIVLRLPLVVRYNVLSLETSPELFVYPNVSKGGLADLAGTGLYGPEISYFNHSCANPNVSRYCIGDVMFFVANRDIRMGAELCFSYIEHEMLCENAFKRSALLDMDFECKDNDLCVGAHDKHNGERPNKRQKAARSSAVEEQDEPQYPLIDDEMQSDLMATPATERLELIGDLLNKKVDAVRDFQCDKYQIHILQAITLEGLGRFNEALRAWDTAIAFAVKTFPPVDEITIALRVQAALCAINILPGDNGKMRAKLHAVEALKMHDVLFGGGAKRFFKRYKHELSHINRTIPEGTIQKNIQELFGRSN